MTPKRLAELRVWLKANEYCDVGGILVPSFRVQQMLSILDDYAALKPLVEAVMGAELVRAWEHGEEIGTGKVRFDYHAMDDILREALAYRQKKGA